MNTTYARLYSILFIIFASTIFFTPSANAAIACTTAQLQAAITNAQLMAYCVQQQALIDAQKVSNTAILQALAKKKPASPH